MEELKIGDYVKTTKEGDYSLVYFFVHKDHDAITKYIQIIAGDDVGTIRTNSLRLAKMHALETGSVKAKL